MDDEAATGALDLLLEVTSLLAADMSEGLAAMGLGESRAHALFLLGNREPMTQRELADALSLAPRTVTSLVDALAEADLVTREPHPQDRRATLVTPTPAGETLARRLVDGRAQLARELFADWHPGHLDAFAAGLDTLVDTVRGLLDRTPEERAT